MAEELFNGNSVTIVDSNGVSKITNKITSVYAYLKRLEEAVEEDKDYGWKEDSAIKTQRGKEWYYWFVNENDITNAIVRMAIAELANYKFNKDKECSIH
jgi:hypothetical protein